MKNDKYRHIVNLFIQENRSKMILGSVDLSDSVSLYLLEFLMRMNTNQTNASIKIYTYINQFQRYLSLLENDSQNQIQEESIPKKIPSESFLSSYENPNVILVEKSNDIIWAVNNMKDLPSCKILLKASDFADIDIDAPEDYVILNLDDSPFIMYDNIFLRKCFYKIFNFANCLFWILNSFKSMRIFVLSSNRSLQNSILKRIAYSKGIKINTISYA